MMLIQAAVEIPGAGGNDILTYFVPPIMEADISVGKRVLVPLGKRLVRGFVCSIEPDTLFEEARPVIAVLDANPIISAELMGLAQWISQNYLNPLGRTIKAMYPGALENTGEDILELANPVSDHPLVQQIRVNGPLRWEEAAKMVSPIELSEMIANDEIRLREPQILIPPVPGGEYCISGSVDSKDISKLRKKAPRQAAALEFFFKQKRPLDERTALTKFPGSVLQALVEKGLLIRQAAVFRVSQRPLLNGDQDRAVSAIYSSLGKSSPDVYLLFGVTGSGKTEVYLRAVEKCRDLGRQSLILIPEIGLTEQVIRVFEERLGSAICVLHSGLNDKERLMEWQRVQNSDVDVVIGARSAIFAPFDRLGLVIIDEEQENSFYQDESPRYHAREVAIERCARNNALLILGSATPSIETYYRATKGEFHLLHMPERIGAADNRVIETVNMKQELKKGSGGSVSEKLRSTVDETVSRRGQAILFLNRRGYSTNVVCEECGYILACDLCEVGLNYHLDVNKLICHYCGKEFKHSRVCPKCGQGRVLLMGTGTQKLEEEVNSLLPSARVLRMDSDTTSGRGGHRRVIDTIRSGKTDIIVGTQMVAKGFDFPGVAVVGVINADPMLGMPDFRAREKAFQLLVQVAGRAGRGGSGGHVILQTFDPDDEIFELVRREDYQAFYDQEIEFRRAFGYPPFSSIIRIIFSGSDEVAVAEEADFARSLIEEMVGEASDPVDILGPAPCMRRKVSGRYRYQLLLKSVNLDLMREVARYIMNRGRLSKVRIDVDIDPQVIF
ncbi:MAG: primosomal protein N' [Candidatus Saccharibacteria bacterium]